MRHFNIKNPLSIIAIFCTITEGLCLYALPKLTENNQNIFIWFVIGFPVLLLGLFFFTLIKHHTKLYSPSDFETKDNSFVEIFYGKAIDKEESSAKQLTQSALSDSFIPFRIYNEDIDADKKSIEWTNSFFQRLDAVLPKHKLSRIFYKQLNNISFIVDIEIKNDYLADGKERFLPFVLMNFTGDLMDHAFIGSGVRDSGSGELLLNHVVNVIGRNTK